MRFLATLALLSAAMSAQSPWIPLLGDRLRDSWQAPVTPGFPDQCWKQDDGAIHPVPGNVRLDLWTRETYRNFILDFEFKVAPGANGGIKYLVQRGEASRRRDGKWLRADQTEPQPGDHYVEGTGGLEFQIMDDAGNKAIDPKRRSASLYSLVAPTDPPPVGPGVFHKARIVVRGDHIEHHLDGRKVVDVTLGSPEMEAAWDACKRADIKGMRKLPARDARIAITHHGSQVWYRDVRIQRLP
jgi:hypothetical protein